MGTGNALLKDADFPSSGGSCLFDSLQYHKTELALRTFFMADDARSLCLAWEELGKCTHGLPAVSSWMDGEYEFNRLFVGPQRIPAPLFASAWIESEPQLMGAATMDVRELYHVMGVHSVVENRVPDDHIAFELEACVLLGMGTHGAHRQALQWLVHEHMSLWIPLFVHAVRTHTEFPAFLALMDVVEGCFFDLQRRTAL